MTRSVINSILWYIFLISVAVLSYVATNTPKSFTIEVGPHDTFTWNSYSPTYILGDGTTELYLRSQTDNFTVYGESDYYIASGQPVEMKPGDTVQTLEAHFKLENGHKYLVKGTIPEIFTLAPTTLSFETFRHGMALLFLMSLILLFLSLVYTVIDCKSSDQSRHSIK